MSFICMDCGIKHEGRPSRYKLPSDEKHERRCKPCASYMKKIMDDHGISPTRSPDLKVPKE